MAKAETTSASWHQTDPETISQMGQSIVDVFEVGRECKVDQSNIAKALDLLGKCRDKSAAWYEPVEDEEVDEDYD